METPAEIVPHQPKYKPDAWQQYTLAELGNWVHNLHKRAGHRDDAAKAAKDLQDARNYWLMMGAYLDDADRKLNPAK